jgi:hypothetical protein
MILKISLAAAIASPTQIRTGWEGSAPPTVTSDPVRGTPNRPRGLRNNPEELTNLRIDVRMKACRKPRFPLGVGSRMAADRIHLRARSRIS